MVAVRVVMVKVNTVYVKLAYIERTGLSPPPPIPSRRGCRFPRPGPEGEAPSARFVTAVNNPGISCVPRLRRSVRSGARAVLTMPTRPSTESRIGNVLIKIGIKCNAYATMV